MGRGAKLKAQVFPSVFGGDTMGHQLGEWLPSAKMAIMVGLGNTAEPM